MGRGTQAFAPWREIMLSAGLMRRVLLALALTLAGCGEQRPHAPTAEQNEQLNEAEAMLNEEAGS